MANRTRELRRPHPPRLGTARWLFVCARAVVWRVRARTHTRVCVHTAADSIVRPGVAAGAHSCARTGAPNHTHRRVHALCHTPARSNTPLCARTHTPCAPTPGRVCARACAGMCVCSHPCAREHTHRERERRPPTHVCKGVAIHPCAHRVHKHTHTSVCACATPHPPLTPSHPPRPSPAPHHQPQDTRTHTHTHTHRHTSARTHACA